MKTNLLFMALTSHLLVASFLSAESGDVARKTFQRQCQVAFNEPWRTIPWKISLLEAQKQAAEEQKPIYIWAMDGHPLGCT